MTTSLQNVVRIPSGSTVKHLEKTIGGEWMYDAGLCGWYCSDGRHLNRCYQRDYGDEFVTEYWMYYPDGQSERGEKYLYANPELTHDRQSGGRS